MAQRSVVTFLSRVAHEIARRPWVVASLTLFVAVVLVRPFGDYPLNDDWHYARIAKHYAENGRFALDSPVASSLYGQSLLAWPIIRLFGFSHTALHLETLVLGAVGFWALDALMVLGDVRPRIRTLALVTLALNPLFFYTANSFMTEFYGYVPGLLGAVVWFRSRRAMEARGDANGPAVTLLAAASSAVLFGFTFWVRQFCASLYPALPGATIFALLLARRWRTLVRTAPAFVVGGALYGVILWSFFPWAKATGNFTPQFQGALSHTSTIEPSTLFKHTFLWLIYMGLFFLPVLVLSPWPRARWRGLLATAGALVLLASLARFAIRDVRMDWVHPRMPFLGNIIEDTGLGPITLSDVYWTKLARPRWDPVWWAIVEAVAIQSVALFAPIFVGLRRIGEATRARISLELLAYGALGCGGTLFLSIQAYQMETLDRYHLPSILLLPLFIAVAVSALRNELSSGDVDVATPPTKSFAFAFVVLAPMAWFSIAGLHDYFRWNDARWALFHDAMRLGATPANVEGGYEMNGWLHYDDIQAHRPPTECIGPCRCTIQTWYSQDCSYHIGMNVLPGYTRVVTRAPHYWLAEGPPMYLSKRDH